jgi:hypothetical protein
MTSAAADRTRDPLFDHLAEPRRPVPSLLQFSLGTLLLVTTLIASCLGLIVALPPIGTPLTIVAVLALLRSIAECRRMLQDGLPIFVDDKLWSYAGSLVYTFFGLVAAFFTLVLVSILGTAVAAAATLVVESLVGQTAATIVLGIFSLMWLVATLAVSASVFVWVYWRTITPRLTLDRLPESRRE